MHEICIDVCIPLWMYILVNCRYMFMHVYIYVYRYTFIHMFTLSLSLSLTRVDFPSPSAIVSVSLPPPFPLSPSPSPPSPWPNRLPPHLQLSVCRLCARSLSPFCCCYLGHITNVALFSMGSWSVLIGLVFFFILFSKACICFFVFLREKEIL